MAGYQLFFNRDEKRTRNHAAPPKLSRKNGVNFVAPVDGDFGGTWIATNEFGVSLCLLNGANLTGAEILCERQESRGTLLLELISGASSAAICENALASDLTRFAAFTLVVLEPGQPSSLLEWSGTRKTFVPDGDSYMPLTSSSFDTVAVRKARGEEYLRLLGSRTYADTGLLLDFHRSHSPARGPYSPCMHRPDAETVSFSRIRVTASEASFSYISSAPCTGEGELCTVLSLSGRAKAG